MYGYDRLMRRSGAFQTVTTLTFHQDFTQLLLSSVAVVGPTLTMVRDTAAWHSPAQSPGQVQRAPHQLLENANLGTRTGDLPSGWTWTVETGSVTWQDHADGYSIGDFTVTAQRQILENSITLTGGNTYTAIVYIHACNIASGNERILRVRDTGGTDCDITDTDFDNLGGNAGWYAVAWQQGSVDTNAGFIIGPGGSANATGTCELSRPAAIDGNPLGVALNTPVYCGSTPPLGAWVATDDGDEPKYDQARLASGVYDGSPENELIWTESLDASLENSAWLNQESTVTTNAVANPLNGDITADTIVPSTNSSSQHRVYNDASDGNPASAASLAREYVFSVYAKAAGYNFITILAERSGSNNSATCFDLSDGTVDTNGANVNASGVIDEGDGWYRCWIQSPGAAGAWIDAGIQIRPQETGGSVTETYAGDGTSGVHVWGAQLEQVEGYPSTYMRSTNIPGKHMLPVGVLIEEARTNLQVRSVEFDDAAWGTTNVTIVADDTEAPDSQSTADEIVDDATSAGHRITDSIVLASATTGSFSLYVKANDLDFISIRYRSSTNNWIAAVFDVGSSSVEIAATQTEVGATSGTIDSTHQEEIGNGWFRCTLVGSATGADGELAIMTVPAATGNTFSTTANVTYVGSSTGLWIWQAQAEAGAFPTSPIITGASTETRNGDRFFTGTVDWYDEDDGTWIYEGQNKYEHPQNSGLWAHTLSGNANRHLIFVKTSEVVAAETRRSSDTEGAIDSAEAIPLGVNFKTAVAYADDDWNQSLDGETPVQDITAAFPLAATPTELVFGDTSFGGTTVYQKFIKDFKFHNERRAGATLEADSLPLPLVGWDFTQADLAASSKSGSLVQAPGGTPVPVFTRNDAVATKHNAAGTLVTVGVDEARTASYLFDGASWVNHGVLLEEARTNIILDSEALSDTGGRWTELSGLTVNENTDVAPDGTTTADTLNDADAGQSCLLRSNSVTGVSDSQQYTVSLHVEKDAVGQATRFGALELAFVGGTSTTMRLYFDTSTGEVGSTLGGTGTIDATGAIDEDTHWRFFITGTNNATGNNNIRIDIYPAIGSGTLIQANESATDTGSIVAWGCQVELGGFPTAYIGPTLGSSVTRNAETLLTDEVWWYNDTQGSWFVEALLPHDDGQVFMWALTLSGNNDQQYYRVNAGDTAEYVSVNSGDTNGNSESVGTITYGTAFKAAMAYQDDDLNHSLNGETTDSDGTAAFPLANRPTQLVFHTSSFDGTSSTNGHFKTLEYRPLHLADSVLESQST